MRARVAWPPCPSLGVACGEDAATFGSSGWEQGWSWGRCVLSWTWSAVKTQRQLLHSRLCASEEGGNGWQRGRGRRDGCEGVLRRAGCARSRTQCASCVTQCLLCAQALGHSLLCLSPAPLACPAHWPRSRQILSGAGWVSKNGDWTRIDAPSRTSQMRAKGAQALPHSGRVVVPPVAPISPCLLCARCLPLKPASWPDWGVAARV